jgi:hypothetical protein
MYYKCTFLIIIIVLSVVVYFLYQQISNKLYMKRLEDEFYNLQKLGFNICNTSVDTLIKGKKITSSQAVSKKNMNKFINGNANMLHGNNIVIIDVDTPKSDDVANSDFIINQLPKDTVITKSPNGYHYYFYNDLDIPMNSYAYITIDKQKYALDILDNKISNLFVPPTTIMGKEYKWINSPYHYKMTPISKYYDLFNYLTDTTDPLKMRFINVIDFVKPGTQLYIIWYHDKYLLELYRYIIPQSNVEAFVLYQDNNIIFYKVENKYFMFIKQYLTYTNRLSILSNIEHFCKKYNIYNIIEIEFIDEGDDIRDDIESTTKYLKGKYNPDIVTNKNITFILDNLNEKYNIQSNYYYPNNYNNVNGKTPNGWMNEMHKHILNDIFYYKIEY